MTSPGRSQKNWEHTSVVVQLDDSSEEGIRDPRWVCWRRGQDTLVGWSQIWDWTSSNGYQLIAIAIDAWAQYGAPDAWSVTRYRLFLRRPIEREKG